MRAIALLLILAALTPLALAEPTVEHHVDEGCEAEGLRVITAAGETIVVGAAAAEHCVAVVVTL